MARILFERPANGGKHSLKMKEPNFSKRFTFWDVHFSWGKKQMCENIYLKQHACLVDSLGVFLLFAASHIHFTTQKGDTNWEKWAHFGGPFFELGPQIPKGPIPIQKVGPEGTQSKFWRRSKGLELAGHAGCMWNWHVPVTNFALSLICQFHEFQCFDVPVLRWCSSFRCVHLVGTILPFAFLFLLDLQLQRSNLVFLFDCYFLWRWVLLPR